MDLDKAPVVAARNFPHQTLVLGPLDETHHGVVPRLKEFGEF